MRAVICEKPLNIFLKCYITLLIHIFAYYLKILLQEVYICDY